MPHHDGGPMDIVWYVERDEMVVRGRRARSRLVGWYGSGSLLVVAFSSFSIDGPCRRHSRRFHVAPWACCRKVRGIRLQIRD